MALMILADNPQQAKDQIVEWLKWNAKRHTNLSPDKRTTTRAKHLSIARALDKLSDELALIPVIPKTVD